MKNELSNDRLSAICKKYGLTIAVICKNDAYNLQEMNIEYYLEN